MVIKTTYIIQCLRDVNYTNIKWNINAVCTVIDGIYMVLHVVPQIIRTKRLMTIKREEQRLFYLSTLDAEYC